jgi:hypothetical protein
LSGDIKGEAEKLDKALLELNKSELAHYVSLRKIVLELYQRYLSFNEGNKYYKEEKIHNLIFPIGKNNRNIDYNQHNLWLLDENLVFSDFITSDPTIKAED